FLNAIFTFDIFNRFSRDIRYHPINSFSPQCLIHFPFSSHLFEIEKAPSPLIRDERTPCYHPHSQNNLLTHCKITALVPETSSLCEIHACPCLVHSSHQLPGWQETHDTGHSP